MKSALTWLSGSLQTRGVAVPGLDRGTPAQRDRADRRLAGERPAFRPGLAPPGAQTARPSGDRPSLVSADRGIPARPRAHSLVIPARTHYGGKDPVPAGMAEIVVVPSEDRHGDALVRHDEETLIAIADGTDHPQASEVPERARVPEIALAVDAGRSPRNVLYKASGRRRDPT